MSEPGRSTRPRNPSPPDEHRLCPYLALSADHRTVADSPDRDHHCHALVPPVELTPAEQSERCLTVEHLACDRYLAARRVLDPLDHELVSTRLVVGGRRRAPSGAYTARHTMATAAAGGGLVAAAVAGAVWWVTIEEPRGAVLSGSARSEREAVAAGSGRATTSRTAPPAAPPTGSPAPLGGGVAGASPAASPAESPAPTPAVPTPAPTPARYEVQPGDTLNEIAAAFDTSAAEIMALNGLQSDVIEIGQVLVIP